MIDQEKLQPEILQSRNTLASIQRRVRSVLQSILSAGGRISKFAGIGSLVLLTGCGPMSKPDSQQEAMQIMKDLVAELGRNRAGLQDDGRVLNCGEDEDINAAQTQSENANTEILGPGTKTTGIATRKAGKRWIVCSLAENSGGVAPPDAAPPAPSVPPELLPTEQEVKQQLLRKFNAERAGIQSDKKTMIQFGEGETIKDALDEAKKKLPKNYKLIDKKYLLTRNGVYVAIIKAALEDVETITTEKDSRLGNELLKKGERAFKSCFDRVRARNPYINGTLDVKVLINPDGSINRVIFQESSTLTDAEVRDCISSTIRGWRFSEENVSKVRSIEFIKVFN